MEMSNGQGAHTAERPRDERLLAHRLLPAYLPSGKDSTEEVDETQQQRGGQAFCVLQALCIEWGGQGRTASPGVCLYMRWEPWEGPGG